MRHLADESVQTTGERVVIRSPIEIVQDLDCILYLLSGLREYDDQNPAYDLSTLPQDPTYIKSSSTGYCYPSSKTLLFQNLFKFQEIKSACTTSLTEALGLIRREAEAAVEYYGAKGKFCEVYAITNALLDSPETYKTTAVHTRNQQLEASGRLEAISRVEKQCGRLFLVIKSSTLPSYLNPSSTRVVSISDIQAAERHLSDLIRRLKLPRPLFDGDYPVDKDSLIRSKLAYFTYSKVDPLRHRALTLMERDGVAMEALSSTSQANPFIQQRNLLGETGVHFALRQNLSTVFGLLCSVVSTNRMEYGNESYTDIRGMNFLMAAVLYRNFNELFSKLPYWEIDKSKCFMFGKEVFHSGSRYASPDSINYLNVHQLAAATGELDVVRTLADHCPGLHLQTLDPWSQLYKTSNARNIVLNELYFNIDLGFFPPVALAAMCDNSHLIPYLLGHLIRSTVNSEESLWGLIILAFKLNLEEFLAQLSSSIQRLDVRHLVKFTEIAIEAATPVMFRKWVKMAWDERPDKSDLYRPASDTGVFRPPQNTDISLFIWPQGWNQNSWYTEAWHRLVKALGERYQYNDALEKQEFLKSLQQVGATTWQGMRCQCTRCLQGQREIDGISLMEL
ncbi:hypothetical protein TWF281_006551 [Arthrobotrys megalospora]